MNLGEARNPEAAVVSGYNGSGCRLFEGNLGDEIEGVKRVGVRVEVTSGDDDD